jgi:hypothetical protein
MKRLLKKYSIMAAMLVATVILIAPSGASAQVEINEVFYLGNAATDWIELKNTGGVPVDVTSWWLCARFSYAQMGTLTLICGSLVIPPGGITVVQSWTDLNNVSSDMGLYITAGFGTAANMRDFMQYGGAGIGREGVAVTAGLWNAGDFVPTAAAGQSVMWNGLQSGGGNKTLASDFANGVPTQCTENAPVSVEEANWGRIKAFYR